MKYINSMDFILNYIKINTQRFLNKVERKSLVNSEICYVWGGGLIERGAYLKFWLRGEGLIREGGLIERGAS